MSGTGDDVILFRPAPDTVTLTHQGESNFSVSLMADSFSARI
ncbi:hypothetical protein ACVGVM_22160 [Pseudonocardia bannensis]|nr:hypothetical protein [Pseudonocardia bannensis]